MDPPPPQLFKKHLSIRKMRLCQIDTLMVCVNLVFFNYANFVT